MSNPSLRFAASGIPESLELFLDILEKGWDLHVQVTGNSMYPYIRSGDVVAVRKVSPESLKTGDLVLGRYGNRRIKLHRILMIDKVAFDSRQWKIFTKGDALICSDPPLFGKDCLGKLVGLKHRHPAGNVFRKRLADDIRFIHFLLAIFFRIKSGLMCVFAKCLKKRKSAI